jgi:UDP-N-acetylmuramoyl-L-alanyl-D-glutamate--2,6-diaminopimelate ligase
MKFSQLLESSGLEVATLRGEAEVAAVTDDSRRCEAGRCFVAVRGTSLDGHAFIPAAVEAGCSAVVCEDPANVPAEFPCAVVSDGRDAVGRLAQAVRGWPARKLVTIGITGTNGKSTVACLLREMLLAAGHRPGVLGTISYEIGDRSLPAGTTTPDPVALADMTAEMVDAGLTHLVMEVSSHALDQRRTAGVEFRVGIFTNLSGDHLDYHETMGKYLAAKRKLFESLAAGSSAVLNRDEPTADEMARATQADVLWYGLSPAAELHARIEQIDASGTRFTLIRGDSETLVDTPLIGRHNVYNCLAAVGACDALGIDHATAAAALGQVRRIPGRLERVHVEAPYTVFVDYAHTDDALSNVLGSLRPVTQGQLIVVFGCGGDRDRTKRPRMAQVAERQADRIVVTSDNPRTEVPGEIIEQIVDGFSEQGRAIATVEPDRAAAIEAAIGMAGEGDVVIVAGKGHENYQVIGTERIHFDDAEVAAEVMQRRARA